MKKVQTVTPQQYLAALATIRPTLPMRIPKLKDLRTEKGSNLRPLDLDGLHCLLDAAETVLRSMDTQISAVNPAARQLPGLPALLERQTPRNFADAGAWLDWHEGLVSYWREEPRTAADVLDYADRLTNDFETLQRLQDLWARLVIALTPAATARHTERMTFTRHDGSNSESVVLAWSRGQITLLAPERLIFEATRATVKAMPKTFRDDKLEPDFDLVVARLLRMGYSLAKAPPTVSMTWALTERAPRAK